MESGTVNIDAERFNQLLRDVTLIKQRLDEVTVFKEYWESTNADDEGELTDWAKKELAEARKIPDSENISLEELEQQLFSR